MKTTKSANQDRRRQAVIAAVLLFGLVSCFGDVIYEGARSANGQYFNLLAVDAATLGVLYGVGEFLGYAVRLLSGKLCDATGKHWLFIFIGYGALIAVPLMGMARSIPVLFALFLIERIGKALRNPPKDTILSQVAENHVGTGMVFGLQEALDQLGAFLGPLVFTVVFLHLGTENLESYRAGYRVLFAAFAALMLVVWIAYRKISKYNLARTEEPVQREAEKLTKLFWLYCLFTFFAAFGLVAYSIIGYHWKAQAVMPDAGITALYSAAMIVDAVVVLLIGRLYDRMKERSGNRKAGLFLLPVIPVVSLAIPFLVLGNALVPAIFGLILYGVVLGGHETIMRSAIADLTAFRKRGTAYGIFNAIYGLGLLGGSAVMGLLYDHAAVVQICAVTVLAEAAALVVFFRLSREIHRM